MNKLLDQVVTYWPISVLVIELFIVILFVVLLKADNYWKRHRLSYALECEIALNNQNINLIDDLKKQLHQGNIKYLEDKKEWFERIYQIQLSNNLSVFQIKQDIDKVEKQIQKLKSK